jgi:sugar phosphate isomerase/epimerase
MRKIAFALSLLFSLAVSAQGNRQVSVFADHIKEVARQQKISFKEAAQKVFDLGCTGADVPVNNDAEYQYALDEIGFRHSCVIAHIDFCHGDKENETAQTLKFMRENNYNKVLLVPGSMEKNATSADYEQLYKRIGRFVSLAKSEGMEVVVEDYDNAQSPCFNTRLLDRMFTAIPDLGLNCDTGNFLACGEDLLEAANHFYGKVRHVHLKDRKSATDLTSVAVGTGVIPVETFITRLLATGYKGWLTLECFGVKDMYDAIKTGVETVNKAYDSFEKAYPNAAGMYPQMTENWTPQPKKVTVGDVNANAAPSDAIVLFDGTNLDEWRKDNGEPAGWKVADGIMTVDKSTGDIVTRREFGSFQLHLEWRIPEGITGESQARGNSGVFMQDKYEVQILDNYDNDTYVQGGAAGIYKQTAPLVNAMRKPGEWNVYDIIYTAPVFKADGTYLYRPYITILHNGVIVQNHTEIYGTTEYIGLPRTVKHGNGPIRLQSHGDPSAPISFRNIWIREL